MTYFLLIVHAYSLNTTANESLRVTGMQFLLITESYTEITRMKEMIAN